MRPPCRFPQRPAWLSAPHRSPVRPHTISSTAGAGHFTLLISHPIGSACQFRGESPPLLRLKVPSLSSWIDPVSMFRVLILGFSLAACRGRGCTNRSGLRRRLAHQPPRGHGRTQVPFRSPALSSGSALSQNRTPTYSLGNVSKSSLRHQRIACLRRARVRVPCDGAAGMGKMSCFSGLLSCKKALEVGGRMRLGFRRPLNFGGATH